MDSYYEELKLRILSQPFHSPEDQTQFEVPIERWTKREQHSDELTQEPILTHRLEDRCFSVVQADVALLPVDAVNPGLRHPIDMIDTNLLQYGIPTQLIPFYPYLVRNATNI